MQDNGHHHHRVIVVDGRSGAFAALDPKLAGERCGSGNEALDRAERSEVDLVVLELDALEGLELCHRLHERSPDVPVIALALRPSVESVIAAFRAGASDVLPEPLDPCAMNHTIERALERRAIIGEVQRLREQKASFDLGALIGASAPMRRVQDMITRVAPSDASVLITGESGTGKELVARALHDRSARAGGPFVAINCAAVPPSLLEAELFGHAKGAFTDAKAAREGLFASGNGGTVFLDEVGEMPSELQPKLLRALQERRVRPIGAAAEISFDVRLLTATNRDLEGEVHEKRFREDLYYRINVVGIHLPALRERGSDILLLAQAFVDRYAVRAGKPVRSIAAPAAEKLLAYDWPGNVRELENCIERAVVLARHEVLGADDLPQRVREHRSHNVVLAVEDPAELVTIDELERRYIAKVIAMVGGNKSKAAHILGLDRRTLYRKLDRYAESL